MGSRASMMTLLERHAYQGRHSGAIDVLAGYPDGITPDWMRDIQQHPAAGFMNVHPAVYERDIRQWFRSWFGADLIQLTPSATMAFTIAADAITSPGDEWILQEASYDSWPLLLQRLGAHVRYAKRDPNGLPSTESIAAQCTKRTRAVLIVCPDNPLGTVTPAARMEQIIDLCKERDLTLVIDYSLATVNPLGCVIPHVPRMPSASDLSWIAIGDTGKWLGLNGTKFGALMYASRWHYRLNVAASVWGFQHNQYDLAVIADILRDSRFRQNMTSRRVAGNYAYLLDELDPEGLMRTGKPYPLTLQLNGAGPFALVDAAGLGMDDAAYAKLLREQHATLTVPLSWFPSNIPDTRVRVSLARSGETMVRLAQALKASAGI